MLTSLYSELSSDVTIWDKELQFLVGPVQLLFFLYWYIVHSLLKTKYVIENLCLRFFFYLYVCMTEHR